MRALAIELSLETWRTGDQGVYFTYAPAMRAASLRRLVVASHACECRQSLRMQTRLAVESVEEKKDVEL